LIIFSRATESIITVGLEEAIMGEKVRGKGAGMGWRELCVFFSRGSLVVLMRYLVRVSVY